MHKVIPKLLRLVCNFGISQFQEEKEFAGPRWIFKAERRRFYA